MKIRIFHVKKIVATVIALAIFISMWFGHPTVAQAYSIVNVEGHSFKVSENRLYATNKTNLLYSSSRDALPDMNGWQWEEAGNSIELARVAFTPYRPVAPGYGEVALPNDCIKTAQIVSVMLVVKNKQRNALYKYKGFPEPQDLYNNSSNGVSGRLVVPIQPGEAYILAHSDELGDFHAATVIAQDEGDNVTMEADACDSEAQPITLEPRHIVFDMYNEQPGREKESFWGTQGAKISDRVFKVSLQRGSGLICDLNFNLGSKKEELLGSIMGFKKPTSVPNQC